MDILLADDNLQNVWDDYVLDHPQGFAYHLYAWRRAVADGYGFPGLYLMARDGAKVRGVLPMIEFRLPLLGRRLVSLPYCDAGGVLADDNTIARALVAEAGERARQAGAGSILMRQADFAAGNDAAPAAAKVLMELPLPDSAEQLLDGFRAKLRSQVRKPQRDGLGARLGGAELLDLFYAVFARNMRDLGSPVHSAAWLRQVLEAFGERARVGLVQLPDGQAVAAGIILFTRRRVSIPWASSLREWNHLNPNMLLYWSLLAFAADNGFETFDFGRSTPDSGTYRFKAQWGALPLPLRQREDRAGHEANGSTRFASFGRRMAEAAWARLPLPATTALGPKLRRYISL